MQTNQAFSAICCHGSASEAMSRCGGAFYLGTRGYLQNLVKQGVAARIYLTPLPLGCVKCPATSTTVGLSSTIIPHCHSVSYSVAVDEDRRNAPGSRPRVKGAELLSRVVSSASLRPAPSDALTGGIFAWGRFEMLMDPRTAERAANSL